MGLPGLSFTIIPTKESVKYNEELDLSMQLDLIKLTFFTSVNHNFSVCNILSADTTGSNNWLKCLHGTAVCNKTFIHNSQKNKTIATSALKEYMLLFTLSHRLMPRVLWAPYNSNCNWKHYTQSYCTGPRATTNIFVFCQWGIYIWNALWNHCLRYDEFVHLSINTSNHLIWLLVRL